MKCPECNGLGKHRGFGCPGLRPVELGCELCGGSGQIGEEQARWRKTGERLKQARIDRLETLRRCAARLGVNPNQLSLWERGVDDPSGHPEILTVAEKGGKP
jgi:DNA-binding XRE family transcriptional regulator